MDKDEIKGKMKDIAGRAERQAGEWTGDEEAQAKGTEKQAEGKTQNAWGKAKDAARDLADDLRERKRRSGQPDDDSKVKDSDKAA